MQNTQGFTVIELAVVMVILGVLASIAVPNFRDHLNQKKLDSAVQEITSNLAQARSQALVSNQNTGICLSTAPMSIQGCATQLGIDAQHLERIFVTLLPDIQLTAASGYVLFNRQGVIEQGDTKIGLLRQQQGRCIVLTKVGSSNVTQGVCT